jgi:Flp pilus assembly protein TadG
VFSEKAGSMLKKIWGALKRREGSVSVVIALTMPALFAMTGLVAEYGNGLVNKVEDQRVADAAAFYAATAYSASSSNSVTSAADAVAALNGIPATDVTATLQSSSPSGDGNKAVEVTISTNVSLLLSKVLLPSTSSITVTATSYAEIQSGGPPCIVALSGGGTGVTLSGSGSITASSCAVESQNSFSVPCGTTITTTTIDYGGSAPSVGCGGIVPPSGQTLSEKHTTVSDPLSGNTVVSSLRSRLSTVEAMTQPSGPSSTSTCVVNIKSSSWSGTCPSDCSAPSGGVFTCTGTGVHHIHSFTMPTGGTNSISAPAGGEWDIDQGIVMSGGGSFTFPSGTYVLGSSSSNSCNSSNSYSICNSTSGAVTFTGPITMTTSGGIYSGGGTTLHFGTNSTSNSFNIGKAADGRAVDAGGGAKVTFGDASGTGDVFQLDGDVYSSGGSCLALSSATNQDVNGYITSSGGLMLGAGTWTISDYLALGDLNGGAVTCTVPWGVGSKSVGLYAVDVSIVLGGQTLLNDSTCPSSAFCIAAGFTNVTLEAPTSGGNEDMGVIGPSASGGATFGQGASGGTITGAFYFPSGAITMSGGASQGSGTGNCLEMIGSQVTVKNGASTATYCTGLAGGQTSNNSGGVALVE